MTKFTIQVGVFRDRDGRPVSVRSDAYDTKYQKDSKPSVSYDTMMLDIEVPGPEDTIWTSEWETNTIDNMFRDFDHPISGQQWTLRIHKNPGVVGSIPAIWKAFIHRHGMSVELGIMLVIDAMTLDDVRYWAEQQLNKKLNI